MPQIDFYVLTDSSTDAHLRYACRLAEQAVERGQRVFMRTTTSDDSKRIDDLLWTFGDRSFLPHEVATTALPSHEKVRVLIGTSPPAGFSDLVINLSVEALPDSQALLQIVELVPVDAERKRQARERFKIYRDRGIEPTTHTV